MSNKNGSLTSADSDGGYFAIKGFLFQFDKTLAEIIKNPSISVEVEQTQDIGVGERYTQVKHKETQDYTPSKIKAAIKQLLNEHKKSPQSKYALYCYFRDRHPQELSLDANQLDQILGADKTVYTSKLKKTFLKCFTLVFADDFEAQFDALLQEIKAAFRLRDKPEALVYHALLRSRVMDLSVLKDRSKRTVTLDTLKAAVSENEKIIFDLAYAKYVGNEAYLKLLKKEYFTFKNGINIPNNERLLIIGADHAVTDGELITIIQGIQSRYYSRDNSPAPYVYLHDVDSSRLAAVKQQLWSKGLYFADGTHFNGDKFRPEDLIASVHDIKGNAIRFKLVDALTLENTLKLVNFDEVYAFLNTENSPLPALPNVTKTFYIEDATNVMKVV